MLLKYYISLLALCLIPYTLAEADADADAEADAGADADPKSKAKPSFSSGCPTSMKGCSNGICLPEKWFCDGDKDCPWGEDEQNCGGQIHWQPNSPPKPRPQWVPAHPPWTVPIQPEPQPEPEPQIFQPQPEPQFWQPQPEPQVWQTQPQPRPQPQPQAWQFPSLPTHGGVRIDPLICPVDTFSCGSACLPLRLRCNGIQDCSDGSDERGCGTNPPGTLPTCADDEVQCYAGNCIKKTSLCDGLIDCRHFEDEFYQKSGICIQMYRTMHSTAKPDEPPPPPPPPTTSRPIIRFCDPGYTLIYDRCIRVTVFPPLDWQSAKAASQAANSLLVEIDNGDFFLELQAYLNQSRYESYSYWTGATDLDNEGYWKWSGSLKNVHLGAPLWSIAREGNTYQQQPAGGREENCGLLEDCPFQYMNDEKCEKKYPYICQRPNDGTVKSVL
ncbi:Very low-density lipoprotein receptor, partial [Armadillidium nasatum]